jgi:pyruvate,orthophosphate dikinase
VSVRKKAGTRKKSAAKKTRRKKAAKKKAPRKKAASGKAAKKKTTAKKTTAKKAPRKKAASGKAAKKTARKKVARPARRVFSFGGGRADGRASMRDLLGGKGANLAEMSRLGIPVPPGFTISTEVCGEYQKRGKLSREVKSDVLTALTRVEQGLGRRLGDPRNPLLVSVRSGARVSMPGMMDTVLNLGLNDVTVRGLAERADARFAYDSYRRFIQMYGDVVLGVPREAFESCIGDLKEDRKVYFDTDLAAEDWQSVVRQFLEIVEAHTGRPFPQDPAEQLWGAVGAVFRSWGNERARVYRRLHDFSDDWGTAVNVQAMVFGNMGDDCATGVVFTRDPATGANHLYGEYLKNAQGEDVVAGVRTPQPIDAASRQGHAAQLPTLEEEMPAAYRELRGLCRRLERHYREMQDIEFTIEAGSLWLLQTRTGKRTPPATVQVAVDLVKERLITREEALLRVDASALDQLLHPTLDRREPLTVLTTGLGASPGAAVGKVVFDAETAESRAKAGDKVILVRMETSPEDIVGMNASEGILTATGGMTSHAAVVARGMGKCCVVGCGDLSIDPQRGVMRIGEHELREGDALTLDGASGDVILGSAPTVLPELGGAFDSLMRWADRYRKLKVRTNADTPGDASVARKFGAEGIGLCRTEHMFFEPARILAVRRMILADDEAERQRALDGLLPMQRSDFEGIFRAMDGLPVTIRLLDPPLHEFLPHEEDERAELARELGISLAALRSKLEALHEFNPMLGHRGCRLGISYPEIYVMQVRAITEAACAVAADGVRVKPEIMIPLVANDGELERLRAQSEKTIGDVRAAFPGTRVRPIIGTMIEVPRAALTADVIARHADFFSFGTNDLTQMGYAMSRDDVGKFLPDYLEKGILEDDPFVSIDQAGIGQLVELGAARGRATRPDLKLGVCGEHGGDPKSVLFFARVGLDYVSCSPYRVPLARLAAAQAALSE